MHMSAAVSVLSNLGDQVIVLPFIAVVAVALVIIGERRAALLWCLALCGVLFAVLVAKLIFIPCGHMAPELELRSPSGHAASAFATYGGFAVLWTKLTRPSRARLLVLVIFGVSCVGIAATRFYLGAHNVPEILLGSAVGLAAPVFLNHNVIRQQSSLSIGPVAFLFLLLFPLALVAALPAHGVNFEGRIAKFALEIARWMNICRM